MFENGRVVPFLLAMSKYAEDAYCIDYQFE